MTQQFLSNTPGTATNAPGVATIVNANFTDVYGQVATAQSTGTAAQSTATTAQSTATSAASAAAAALSYTPPFTGGVATTVAGKLAQREVTTTDFGADPTGAIDCTAAFSKAASFSTGNATAIWVPRGTYNGATGITATDLPLWIIPGEAKINGGIVVGLGYDNRPALQFSQTGTTANDYGAVTVRRTTSHTGGATTNVNAGFRVDSYVSAGVTNIEWALVGVIQNSSTGGQNTGIFGQGNRLTSTTGPTFAATMEARDASLVANPTAGLVGMELDCRAAGTDTGLTRVGLDVVCTRPYINGVLSGATATISWGVRVGSFADPTTTVTIGYTVYDTNVGIAYDCSAATVTGAALRMASGVPIAFDASSVNTLLYDGTGLNYKASGASVALFAPSGSFISAPVSGTGYGLTVTCQLTYAAINCNGALVCGGNTLAHANQTVTNTQVILQGGSAEIVTINGAAGTNLKVWSNFADTSGVYHFRLENDALSTTQDWMSVTRTAATSSVVALVNSQMTVTAPSGQSFVQQLFSTGTFAVSQIQAPASSSAYWQASVSGANSAFAGINGSAGTDSNGFASGNIGFGSPAAVGIDLTTSATSRLHIASGGAVTIPGTLNINGAVASAQVTGWGTSVGGTVIASYNITDAGGANSNTNKAVAKIIADLKAFGIYGA